MTLLGELKTLKETMCTSCQQSASSKTTRSGDQSFVMSTGSTIATRACNVGIPTLASKTDVFLRTPAPRSSSPPINEKINADSNSLVEISTGRSNLAFHAEPEALADISVDVTFMYSFRHEDSVGSVCFSLDGRYLAVGFGSMRDMDGSIVIYEVEGRKKYCELREYASQYGSYTRPFIWHLCFSADGRYLAVSDAAQRLVIWDIPNKRMRSIFREGLSNCEVRFSPDGCLVAICNHAGLLVLNVRDGSRKLASKLMGSHFDFSPNGRCIATWSRDILVILDVRTGKAAKRWKPHGKYPSCVKFTLDGRGLLCTFRGMTEQWDVSGAEPVLIRKFDLQSDHPYRTCISPDHRLVASDNQIWDVNSGKRQYTLQGHNGYISTVDFAAAGTYFAIGSWDGFISLWRYTWA